MVGAGCGVIASGNGAVAVGSCDAGTDQGRGMSSGSCSMVVGTLAAFTVGMCGDGLGGFSEISWGLCSMSVGTGRVGAVVLNR